MRRSSPRTIAPQTKRARAAALLLVRLSVWALVGLHVLLFVRRIGDASMADPVIAVRWLGAAALLLIGWLHVRRGGSLVAGRGALAFWLAVFLLHAFALAPGAAPIVDTTTPGSSLGLVLVAALLLVAGLLPTTLTATNHPLGSTPPIHRLDRVARCWARPPPHLSLFA